MNPYNFIVLYGIVVLDISAFSQPHMPIIDTSRRPEGAIGNRVEYLYHDTSLGKIDPTDIELYLPEHWKHNEYTGEEIQKDLRSRSVLNEHVLNYYLRHKDLIPEKWKAVTPVFWGTTSMYIIPDWSRFPVVYGLEWHVYSMMNQNPTGWKLVHYNLNEKRLWDNHPAALYAGKKINK